MTEHVGIVLVSHSAAMAAGLRELLVELGSGAVPVLLAGGTEEGGLGTSYDLIVRAVAAAAEGGAGVVVLPDLGSSVLTARTALEDHPHAGVVLVDAPFVEGAVAAVVTASAGAGLAEVVSAAEGARDFRKL
ncbi:dihydroxyacetone kinase phosphoryl donor subunit DhaM [Kitasatospora sp. MAP5-34]|uniref:dihydroxyacetone kinase phosphoryl donor subunit DhaM n=1 Tax=Kitasatospora sp. MAP5-34 TaxID=3035102 RepID=UPI00247655E3|nr:dihydroxyacetone kinase phosphoryl donor subunit DhaM [Kitasatospora sp. MAP5-34]MDH6578323.1 PTS hybrid protein [Kitasatospora sp. MAP5-34]